MSLRAFLSLTPPLIVGLLFVALAPGCDGPAPAQHDPARTAPPATPEPEAKKTSLGPNVFLEVQGKRRRVLIDGEVCQRGVQLEMFLCPWNTKEHEAIVHAKVDGRHVHAALLAAGAEPGSPVRYDPKYTPARGSTIKVGVEYEDKGRLATRNAREWVRYSRTGKELDVDWVFAGSVLVDDALDRTKPKAYLANDGDMICVSNFEDAMLDLPINSSKDNADLSFETFTERIPPIGTKVVVTLEPVPAAKKGK
jgi:hypothetical protein